jgi:poly(hydroxyalkanoate) granule-associated protein
MAQFTMDSAPRIAMTSNPQTAPETDEPAPAGWPHWQPPPGLPEPARQVWLAGLGALARAQAEGGKAFETLVHQGLALQTQATQMAQERLTEAAQTATQPWERLSGIFEDRVARALASLGLPTAQDWAALQARVQALEAAVQDVSRAKPQPTATRRPAKSAPSSPAATAQRAAVKPRAPFRNPKRSS